MFSNHKVDFLGEELPENLHILDPHRTTTEDIPFSFDYQRHLAQIRVKLSAANEKNMVKMLRALAEGAVSFDMVVIEPHEIRFTSEQDEMERACNILHKVGYDFDCVCQCAKAYVTYNRNIEQSSLVASISQTLSKANMPILQILETSGTIAILVEEIYLNLTLTILARKFAGNHCFPYKV